MRERRGPLAALLILVGLLFSSGAVAGAGARDISARLSPVRQGSASSLERSSVRATLPDEASPTDSKSFLPPPQPRLASERLTLQPSNSASARQFGSGDRAATASYRARAPPAA